MEAQTIAEDSGQKVSGSLKHFFLAICRMHKQNNFNRFESVKIHNKVDDLIKQEKKDEKFEQAISDIKIGSHSDEINAITNEIKNLAEMNSKLVKEMNTLISENTLLKTRMHKFEHLPAIKVISKDKKSIAIGQDEHSHIQDLKNKIDFLERKYETLTKEENYDDRLLLNHKERIEILKEKLHNASLDLAERNNLM